jgi:trehalose 6-phosphate phosphatase
MRSSLPPARPDWALFLDVDGTLVEFADRPDTVRPDADLRRRLPALADRLGGALALVSGRAIESLDALFQPLRLPSAGLHGLERRGADGRVHRLAGRFPDDVRAMLDARLRAARADGGLVLEHKGATVAVHWRGAPDLAPAARDAAASALACLGPDWQALEGACVVELKPAAATKGDAVRAFLATPPFAARVPVYVGDDVTDADGIAAAEAMGGVGIAVGTRVAARYRLDSPAAVRAWLADVERALDAAHRASLPWRAGRPA